MKEYLKRVMELYRKSTPAEWGAKCAKSLISKVPGIGWLLAEALGPAFEAAKAKEETAKTKTAEMDSLILAAGTFSPGGRTRHWARNIVRFR